MGEQNLDNPDTTPAADQLVEMAEDMASWDLATWVHLAKMAGIQIRPAELAVRLQNARVRAASVAAGERERQRQSIRAADEAKRAIAREAYLDAQAAVLSAEMAERSKQLMAETARRQREGLERVREINKRQMTGLEYDQLRRNRWRPAWMRGY